MAFDIASSEQRSSISAGRHLNERAGGVEGVKVVVEERLANDVQGELGEAGLQIQSLSCLRSHLSHEQDTVFCLIFFWFGSQDAEWLHLSAVQSGRPVSLTKKPEEERMALHMVCSYVAVYGQQLPKPII